MAKITYENKQTLNANPSIPSVNKVESDDMNEIKSVVNENDTNVGDLSNLNTTDKTSVVNAINEVNTNQINSSTYSTEEKPTGKWIDNKPTYTKTINIGALPNNGRNTVVLNLTNIDKVVDLNGIGIRTNPQEDFKSLLQLTSSLLYRKPTDTLFIDTITNNSGFVGYLTVEYTKTTD